MDQKKEQPMPHIRQDAFGDEEFAEVKYKVLKWWCVYRLFRRRCANSFQQARRTAHGR
jgi:hypothetical protein